MRSLASLPLLLSLLAACSSDPDHPAGAGGSAGTGGAGLSGTSGQSGQAGAGQGGAGQAGASAAGGSGQAGAGAGGQGGSAAGEAGAAGSAGAVAGGAAGQGGSAGGQGGTSGAAGGGAGGAAGGASGAGPAAVCGDGVRGGAEACDGQDVGGATCASLGAGGLPAGPDGKPLSLGGPGEVACSASCALDVGRCDPPVRAIGSLGPGPAEGGEAYFSEAFAWDAAASVFRTSVEQRLVTVPAGMAPPDGVTLLAFDDLAKPWTLPPGASPPGYPYLRVDTPGQPGPLYDPCWDHDCSIALPPRPLLPARRAPLMLRQTGADAYAPGTGQPWVRGRGKLRLVVAVAYAGAPMPEAALAPLLDPAGAADSTSLAAIPPWYAARSQDLGLPSPVDLEIVWSKVQVEVPPAQVPAGYDACVAADWKPLLAPSLALSPDDVLVQIYWGPDGSQCASHVLRSSRSFVLFAHPSYLPLPGLVVSGAHELMHLFGASDKYTDSLIPDAGGTYRGCWFDDSPLYAARDIMCHRVPVLDPDGTVSSFTNPPLHELTVAPLTAREVGWEDLDGDGVIEVEDACPWDGGC